ncbi:MAG: HAD-IA family hydrolase [Alphaproteobacteria bacterium]|nr:HAD-IA family hydrolase [Alphaproteobacteria bacterium]
MGKIRFVVFDCDGTLIDSLALIAEAAGEALAAHGIAPPSLGAVRRVVGMPLEEAIATLAQDADPVRLAALADAYRSRYHALRTAPGAAEPLFPGARAVLDRLRAEGILIGMATNKGRRGVDAVLATHDLEGHFAVLRTADDGPAKPDPFLLVDAMAEAGMGAHETVLVGDTIYDMAMARAAGTGALGVAWGYHAPEELSRAGALAVIEDFEALHSHLGEEGP